MTDKLPIEKCADRFTEADLDQEIVVMRLDTGEFFSLWGTSASIWRLIDGRRDRDELVAALAAEFAADVGAITTDVDAFLMQLRDTGLLAGD